VSWRTDVHGQVFACDELKLFKPSHSWGMKLSQLGRQSGPVHILTYSFPDVGYIEDQFGRRPCDVWLVGHERFRAQATQLKRAHPQLRIATLRDMHSKVVLIAPATAYIGSSNFGRSTWHETTIGIRSSQAHDWLLRQFVVLWQRADEVR
jgi:hypothetical protein